MKKISFLIFIALLFPCSIPGADKAEKTVFKSCFIVKNNDEANFRVELPEGWTAKLGEDQKLNIFGEKKDGKKVKKAMILVGFDINKSDGDIPADYLEKIKSNYKALMDDKLAKKGVKQTDATIGKNKAVRLEYQLKIGKTVSKYWQYLNKLNKQDIAIITCTAPVSSFKDFEEDFKVIMESVEIQISPVGK